MQRRQKYRLIIKLTEYQDIIREMNQYEDNGPFAADKSNQKSIIFHKGL